MLHCYLLHTGPTVHPVVLPCYIQDHCNAALLPWYLQDPLYMLYCYPVTYRTHCNAALLHALWAFLPTYSQCH